MCGFWWIIFYSKLMDARKTLATKAMVTMMYFRHTVLSWILCQASSRRDEAVFADGRLVRRMITAAVGIVFAGMALSPAPVGAQTSTKPVLEQVWSFESSALGTDQSLEPTLAITADQVLIDASIKRDDRSHEVIRAFDIQTGEPTALVEHPDGEAFEGLGDAIANNERFMVTALSGKAQFGVNGELLVYDAGSLELLRRIKNPRESDATFFGATGVVLHDDRILAAVPQSADNLSTAWVFSAETGEVLLKLDEPHRPKPFWSERPRSVFGRSLTMNATHIAIAANDLEGPSGLFSRGVVFVFDATDGSLLYQLRTPGSDKATGFGGSLTMSGDLLYVGGTDETGEMGWPTGQVHAYDLASGEWVFTIEDPGVPETLQEFTDGKEGWGFPTTLNVSGAFLVSGLPDWSGGQSRQGGLAMFDARTGEPLLTYGNQSGEAYSAFGKAIALGHGHLVVMQAVQRDGGNATRVTLFRIVGP